MRKNVTTVEPVDAQNILRWMDSIDSGDADYLDDWFNLAEQEDCDQALMHSNLYFVEYDKLNLQGDKQCLKTSTRS